MRQKNRKNVTRDRANFRCPPAVERLIDDVNEIDATLDQDWKELDKYNNPWDAYADQNFCKIIHQMAQLASLPADMREDYARALGGTDKEWKEFSNKAGVPTGLWRKWPEPSNQEWRWPLATYELIIDVNGKMDIRFHNDLTVLKGIDTNRMRECRACQRIFWASQINKAGGPFGCSPRCNNTLRQRAFKDRKRS